MARKQRHRIRSDRATIEGRPGPDLAGLGAYDRRRHGIGFQGRGADPHAPAVDEAMFRQTPRHPGACWRSRGSNSEGGVFGWLRAARRRRVKVSRWSRLTRGRKCRPTRPPIPRPGGQRVGRERRRTCRGVAFSPKADAFVPRTRPCRFHPARSVPGGFQVAFSALAAAPLPPLHRPAIGRPARSPR